MTRRGPAALVVLALLGAGEARAADKNAHPTSEVQAARELFVRARKDEDLGHWADALEKFRRVADVKRTAGVRYHVALCEEKLGLTATAYADYAEAQLLAEKEKSKEVLDLLVEPFLTNLRARVPTLVIHVPIDAQDAEVTLDGKPHPSGLWGIAMPIDPGAHHIEARAPGRTPSSYDLTLKEREAMSLDVALVRIAEPPPVVAPVPVPVEAPKPKHVEPTPAVPKAEPAEPPARSPSRTGAIVATTGAIVLAGGGVAAFLAAGSAQSSARDECAALRDCSGLGSSTRTWDTVALGAWIGAAVVGTVAVVLWATPSRSSATTSAKMTAGPGSLAIEGSF